MHKVPSSRGSARARSAKPIDSMVREDHATVLPALRAVKVVHTLAWSVFAGCIVALPVAAYLGNFRLAAILIASVLVEVLVLFANHFRCPLTDVAARYTSDRRANFDIYLPLWIARYNKEIFGSLFVAGVLFTIFRWRFT